MSEAGRVTFSRVESVIFGEPAARAIGNQIEAWGSQRVMVVASRSLNRGTSCVRKIESALQERWADTIDGIPEHTPSGAVLEMVERAKELDVDAIVTVGGGTLTDAGKAVRMSLANDVASLAQLRPGAQPGGSAPATPTVKQLSVPTTLSAAEFTGIAGVTDVATHTKSLWRQPEIAPNTVILDPALTVHTPEWLFLSTGLRAVDHAVEGFCARGASSYTDAQASRGFRLLFEGLAAVHRRPDDIKPRLDSQMGAWMAMCPLSCGVPMGASHGIGYVLGAEHGIPHGYTSCVILPAVLEWNAQFNGARQEELVRESSVAPGVLADMVRDLVSALGLPMTLTDLGIGVEHDADIAVKAMDTPWVPHNPRPIRSPEDVVQILALAR